MSGALVVSDGSFRFSLASLVLFVSLGLAALPAIGSAAGLPVRLGWTNAPGGVDIFWTSQSLTPSTPFVHYDFQVQHSGNLAAWENAVLIQGGFLGSASVDRTFRLPATNAQGFVRLSYRLNMPGANLSGLDLSGADLRGANLAGADLSGTKLDGALLAGADLTGANLAGATFAGANLQDVNMNGFDLGSLDLSTILGTPLLTQITANPLGSAAQMVPRLPYNAGTRDLVAGDSEVPGIVSTRNAMVMLKTNATVAQLNALLAARGAAIAASSPADTTLPNAVLMLRLPTATAKGLYDLAVVLAGDPIVEAAAPDVLLGLTEIPNDTGAAATWRWDQAGVVAGGNWGLEKARVPQMWNLLSALQLKGVPHVPTCIIDVDFLAHNDVSFVSQIGATGPGTNDHGIHVAGIAGADHDNGRGIDGVNPLASLIGYTMQTVSSDFPDPTGLLGTFEPGRQANGFRMVQDVRNVLNTAPHTRIINMSLGFNWYLSTNSARPTYTSPFSGTVLTRIGFVAGNYGRLFSKVAASASSVLIVCAAGNDNKLVPAGDASPMANAALNQGAPNIIAVEAHDINGGITDFSNIGGQVAAPGDAILSAGGTSGTGYVTKRGTSMAAPFVTGVAGFLLAVDPTLTPPTLISLLQRNGQNVDAFTSMMEIDRLPGRNGEVLKLLLDIDDGSPDGSLRVLVPKATVGRDRVFEAVRGADFDDINYVVGDGVIDMSDFRRWRDWLLYGLGSEDLNGSANHLNHDGNGDFVLDRFHELNYYPRGDFNGDGRLDESATRLVSGHSVALTDLEVLVLSDLWEDPAYQDAFSLFDLINSVDFNVSAENFFYKHTDIDGECNVSVYDADTRRPVEGGGAMAFSPGHPTNIFTVPVGGRYYVASDPISIGDGTNVQMRSIGEKVVSLGERGADFAVDLALREMTAVADTFNPRLRDIDSAPDTNRVEAYLGTTTTATNPPTRGVRSSADEDATLHSMANAGSLPQPPGDPSTNTIFSGAVRWQRSFTKDANLRDPRFFLESLKLELLGSGVGTNELEAFAEFSLEMRAYDRSPAWEPVFFHRAEIAGRQASGGQPHTFRIVGEEGDFPPQPLELNGTFGAKYEQKGKRTPIDLEGIAAGHSFELRVRLNTRVEAGPGGDNSALARLGDPLEYKSGFRMNYGSFGDLPLKKGVSRSAPAATGIFQAAGQPPVVLTYLSKTNFYYRLYRGTDADTSGMPFAMKLGIDGDDTMTDPNPILPEPSEDDYTLENQPIDQPLDFDGDGIDDVYELRRPGILDPLNAADAFLDPDGDGRSNLEEYRDGTDPQTPDSPPANPTLNFPGLIVPSFPGGELIDLNNDGVLDSASVGLNVALAHLGGTFDTPITSPTTGIRIVADTAYVNLDGDAFPDAVVIDFLTNRVFAYRGVGNGTFSALANYAAIASPNLILPCNLNGDALKDIAVFSQNGRGVDLHLNNGDGTLTRTATITTNAYGSGNSFAMADLNNDSRDDIIVGYAFNIVVFLTQPNGTYGPAQPYPVGSFPSSVAVGDLNGDGRIDIVAANASTDDVSVLIASGPGVFVPQVRYPVGDNPRQVQLVRLRANGPLDAVVSLNNVDYQVILPGLGNGAFGPLYTVPTGVSLNAIHDWNGDGKLDLVSMISDGGMVNFGNGDGTFNTRLQIVPTNNPPSLVTTIDLNGDGKLELVGLQTQLNSVDVWEHSAVDGTNRLLASLVVGTRITGYAPGDFNGDGRIDLAVTTQTNSFGVRGSNQVVILTNAGNFVFQDAGHYPMEVNANSVVSADFDGDGDLDLAVNLGGGTLVGGSRIVSLRNNGAGVFQAGASVVVGNSLSAMLPANAEADAGFELLLRGARLVGNTSMNFLEVFALSANGGWTNRQSFASTNDIISLQILSMNGDAYPDLVLLEQAPSFGPRSLRVYPGGPAGFGVQQVLEDGVPFQSFSRLADLNGDGLLDVASFNTIFLAKPGGGFHPAQEIYIGAGGIQGVADFNRDGKPDLLNGLSILLQR